MLQMERRQPAQLLLSRVQLMCPLPTLQGSMTQLQHQQQHPQAMACLTVCTMTMSRVPRSERQSTVPMLSRNKVVVLRPMCFECSLSFLCADGQLACHCSLLSEVSRILQVDE